MKKINIKFTGKEKDILENLMNIAHQIDLQQAQVWFGFYALSKQMHIDDFMHYTDLMKEDD